MSVRVLSLLVLALSACQPLSNVCGEHTEAVASADGGQYRCVRAEDCPRTSNVFVCTESGLVENECVSCEDTVCVRHIPEPCR